MQSQPQSSSKNEVFKHRPALDDEVQQYLKSVFEKVIDDELSNGVLVKTHKIC